jgi:hypothetical protein
MVCAYFIKVAYYCWLKIRFVVLILLTFISSIQKENTEQGRVELRFMPIYPFNDFFDGKTYLNLLPYIARYESENFAWGRK